MFGADRSMSNHSKIPRQVGVVKSAVAVGRTSTSAVVSACTQNEATSAEARITVELARLA